MRICRGVKYFTMRTVARLAKFLRYFPVSLYPQAEVGDGRIDGRRFRKIEACQLTFGVGAVAECCFLLTFEILSVNNRFLGYKYPL